ncbi:MAG: response regulator [Deltaproteobacteria bacterium]|nr:response regulator [Deltaproteobacteria bacterium]
MKTILVIDDEEKIRSVYATILKREGYLALEANSALEANALMLQHAVDLVLLDINMAEVDGTVFYEIIRTFHQRTKVIVASVYPLDDQKHLVEAAHDYYDKSDSLKLLLQKVSTVLNT